MESKDNLTNFQKVVEFNSVCGIKMFKSPSLDDNKLNTYRLSLIDEEVGELHDAVKNGDVTETIDALADILYVVYGCGASMGIDLDKAYKEVHRSNMSKVCETEEIARETVQWYKENDSRYDSPDYRKSSDGKYYIVYNKSTGKILKNKYYSPANFKNVKEYKLE